MSKRLSRIFGIIVLVLCLFGALQLRFGDIMKGGHDRYFGSGGDGFKNYATIIYHVKHDKDWLHYEGMNYPYGEHVLFTDNQPLLANTIKFLQRWNPTISEEIAPIVHWMMLLSFVLSGVFILLIFRRFKLPDWFAIPASIGIVLLSPQLLRMSGHFGLAYAVILPLYLYVLLLFEEKRKNLYALYLFLIIILFAQLHFYYFGILALLTAAYSFFRVIYSKRQKQLTKAVWIQSGVLFGVAVLSYIVLSMWVGIGNPVLDRPKSPWGFLKYRAQWESILLDEQAPFLNFIHKYLVHFRPTEFEGKSYIGLLTGVITIALLVRWIKSKGKKRFFVNVSAHPLYVRSLFASAFVLLLFAMGLPFTIPGMEQFIKYLGPLGQLRSVGRFGWIFFYVINIFGLVYLFNLFSASQAGKSLRFVLLFPIIILFSDGFTFLDRVNNKLHSLKELNRDFDKSDQYWFKDVNPTDYQAILPIPYFHIGSENYGLDPKGGIFYRTTTASLWSGLPSMGVMMSRTSFSQTTKSIGLMMSLGYRIPAILDDLPSKQPLLAMVSKEAIHHRKNQSQFAKDFGQKVFETDKVFGYRLPLDAFAQAVLRQKQELKDEVATRPLYRHGAILSTDSLPNYIYESFDQLVSKKAYYSKSSFQIDPKILRKEKKQTVFDKKMPNPKKGQQYQVSFWVYVDQPLGPMSAYKLYEYDPQQPDKIYTTWDKGIRFDMKKLDNGWAYISETITLKGDDTKIKLDFYNNRDYGQVFWVDELLFRPEGTDLYQVDGATIWKNGWYME